MKKIMCLILSMCLLLGPINPSLSKAVEADAIQVEEPVEVQGEVQEPAQEDGQELISVEIDGQEVQMTEEEYKEYREKKAEELFREAVKKEENKDIKELTHAYLLGDFETGRILYGHNIDEMMAIASLTKILTVYVVLDQAQAGNISLDDMVTIDAETASIGGSSYDLKEGEEASVRDLVKATMVVSGNDATNALAKHVAGSEENFIGLMGAKLEELGINQYNLVNVSGLPKYEPDTQNMMTPRDLFTLARNFIKDYPEILEMTSIPEIKEEARDFDEKNTNPILGELEGIDGLKTGYTGKAGRCMMATGSRPGIFDNTKDIRLIGLTMGSENDAQRYVAIKRIMEDGLDNYMQKIIGVEEEPVATVHGINTVPEEIPVYAKEPGLVTMRKDQEVTMETDIIEIVPPMDGGSHVGSVKYFLDGEEVYATDLIIKDDIVDPTIQGRLFRFYQNGYRNLIEMFT